MFRGRPDRVLVLVIAVAWCWMLVGALNGHRLRCCSPHPSVAEDAIAWLAMVFAMMLPSALGAVRDVMARSYRSRRMRSGIGYVLGYLAWWLAIGAVVIAARCSRFYDSRAVTALVLAGAAWILLPAYARWFTMCHRQIPLYPVGPRADRDAFTQGLLHGGPCAAMCWPVMLACTVSGHALIMMLGGTALVILQKRMFRLVRVPLVIGHILLAVCTL